MKRKILLFTMLLTVLFCFACSDNNSGTPTPEVPSEEPSNGRTSIFSRPTVERTTNPRKDWNDVSSFVCYYGDFDFEFQSQFDVIIMHSSTLYQTPDAKEQVQRLKDECESECKERRNELLRLETRVVQREDFIQKKEEHMRAKFSGEREL